VAAGRYAVTRRQALASLLLTAALAAAGGCAFHRVFGWQALLPVVAVAALTPVLILLPLSARRHAWPLWTSALTSLACWLVTMSATLFRGHGLLGRLPVPATLAVIASALRDSWKAMLTTILPAPASPRLLVLVSALVWFAAFAGAEAALRSSSAAAPLPPAFGVLAVALLLGVDGPGSNLVITAVMLALAGTCLLLRSSWPRARQAMLALPAAGAVAVISLAAGPGLPFVNTAAPYDPRQHVPAPPPALREAVSPLDEISGWLLAPHAPLFTVHASAPENWRLAVLDRFDGTTWLSSARLFPTGSRVPSGTGPPGQTRVSQAVTIRGLTGVWLPAADRPASVTGTGVSVDPASGVLAAAAPLHPGVRYLAVSSVPRYTQAELADASGASDPAARADLALPGNGPGQAAPELALLSRTAWQAVAGSASPMQEALRLADYLRSHEVYDVTAAPGHTYRTIEFFLATTHHGTSEQFATAFAVMARLLGLPSRVAVGFRPGTQGRQPGTWLVHSGDVLAWPEVDFQGLGWVPFYPTPEQAGPRAVHQAVPMGEPGNRLRLDQGISYSGTSAARQHHPPARARNLPGDRPGPGTPWPLAGGVLAGLVVLGYLAAAAAAPVLRRRRRRGQPDPARRVIGAWQQALEHLSRAGLALVPALTAHEVAERGATASDQAGTHLVPLANLVNQVRFGRPQAAGTLHASADAAWHHADAVGRLVNRSASRTRRLGRRLHPRSLRGPGRALR
jgi:Transglutaminase-like superfamily/TgpA N-terminal domain